MDMPACDLVLPCKNEAPALPALLAEVPAYFSVIVVDNGSSDGTAEVAHGLGATVVFEPRPGYGAAVHAGIQAATADMVAVIDGDGSIDPRDLRPLVEAVTSAERTLAVGRRKPVYARLIPLHARAGNIALTWWLRRSLRLDVHDSAPVRVCRRLELLELGIEDRRFGYPIELLVRAQRAGWIIKEYDVCYRPRAIGTTSKVSGSVRGTLSTARDFAKALG